MAELPTVTPMQPTLVSKPFHRPGWVYEEKYDGWRMVALKDNRLPQRLPDSDEDGVSQRGRHPRPPVVWIGGGLITESRDVRPAIQTGINHEADVGR